MFKMLGQLNQYDDFLDIEIKVNEKKEKILTLIFKDFLVILNEKDVHNNNYEIKTNEENQQYMNQYHEYFEKIIKKIMKN